MSLFGQGSHGFSLKALLEDPNLQTPPNINSGYHDVKKGLTGKLGGFVPNVGSAFLGPSLWEKPGDNSNDLNLEYMDLDEFLSENGIPIDPSEQADEETINMLASALSDSPTNIQSPSPDLRVAPPSPEDNPTMAPIKVEMNNMFMSMSPGPTSPAMTPVNPVGATSPRIASPHSPRQPSVIASPHSPRQPSAIEKCLLDDNFGVKQMSAVPLDTSINSNNMNNNNSSSGTTPKKRKAPNIEFDLNPEDLSLATIPVYRQNPVHTMSPASPQWQTQADEPLVNNSIPGQHNFDPTSRKFSEEELKPQPIVKKSKKVFVDETSKDDKYWKRRNKNNVAAKRSRDARRVKENQIAMRASFLEQENDTLREEMEEMQKENELLIQRLSKYEKV